jgi:hypothetical protein
MTKRLGIIIAVIAVLVIGGLALGVGLRPRDERQPAACDPRRKRPDDHHATVADHPATSAASDPTGDDPAPAAANNNPADDGATSSATDDDPTGDDRAGAAPDNDSGIATPAGRHQRHSSRQRRRPRHRQQRSTERRRREHVISRRWPRRSRSALATGGLALGAAPSRAPVVRLRAGAATLAPVGFSACSPRRDGGLQPS